MEILKGVIDSLKRNVWPIVRTAAIAAAITFLLGVVDDLRKIQDEK